QQQRAVVRRAQQAVERVEPELRGQRTGDRAVVLDPGEIDEAHTERKAVTDAARCDLRERGLPDPARTDDRHETMTSRPRLEFLELACAPEELERWHGATVRVRAASRSERISMSALVVP